MGEMGYAFHQNNITIKASMSFRPSEDIGEKLQELKVLVHVTHLLKKKKQQHKNAPVRQSLTFTQFKNITVLSKTVL